METTGLIQFDWSYVMILINVVILYFIMKKYFFVKIRDFMQKRQDEVAGSIERANQVNTQADMLKKTYEEQIETLEEQGKEILKAAKQKAEAQARQIIQTAENQASQILKHTEAELEQQRRKAVEEAREQIAEIAMTAAEKILEKQINHQEHQVIINNVIDEIGKAKWQN